MGILFILGIQNQGLLNPVPALHQGSLAEVAFGAAAIEVRHCYGQYS